NASTSQVKPNRSLSGGLFFCVLVVVVSRRGVVEMKRKREAETGSGEGTTKTVFRGSIPSTTKMSAATDQKETTAKSKKVVHSWRVAAVICTTSSIAGPYIGGSKPPNDRPEAKATFTLESGLGSDLDVFLVASKSPGRSHWQGFELKFDLGASDHIESTGFGVRYEPDRLAAGIEPADQHVIVVKLPHDRSEYRITVRDITNDEELPGPIRAVANATCVTIDLLGDAKFSIDGFGIPFSNPGHPSDDWINRDAPINGGMSLLGLLRSRSLTFIVGKVSVAVPINKRDLDPLFGYPYPYPFLESREEFDIEDFRDMLQHNKGPRFRPTFVFDNDEQSVCNNGLCQVMDMFWLYNSSCEINKTKFPAYFIIDTKEAPAPAHKTMCWAVIALDETMRNQYRQYWERLTQDGKVWLALGGLDGVFQGTIVERPYFESQLEAHAFDPQHSHSDQFKYDLIVRVFVEGDDMHRLKTFNGRVEAESFKNSVTLKFDVDLTDLERKVRAVETFLPGSAPCPQPASGAEAVISDDDLEFQMALHRNIMRGTGFFQTLTSSPSLSEAMNAMTRGTEALLPKPRSIPTFNFFDIADEHLKTEILAEAISSDRLRLERYGHERHYNVALVSGPGGTGKTTALSTLTLGGLHSLNGGKVYGSGPTNTAVSNFALRVYTNGCKVIDRFNKVAPPTSRLSYPLVVRGYSNKAEVGAFKDILQKGVANDGAYTPYRRESRRRWQLALSPSNWLLAILGSKALEESQQAGCIFTLLPQHATFLHVLREEIDRGTGAVVRIRQLARGELTWGDYCNGETMSKFQLEDWFRRIIDNADVVMTTPAQAQAKWFKGFWSAAKVIGIDEAGCMDKADLCSIWGNTLRPIILAGDVKQLTPTIMELNNMEEEKITGDSTTDKEERYYKNRFGLSGRISALAWLQGLGLPTFRLLRQMRMCKGQFDLANKVFYKDYPKMLYGGYCVASHSDHAVGVLFEKFIARQNLVDTLKPSPDDSLLPIFLHMPDTWVASVGLSRLNRLQVERGLELLSNFVKEHKSKVSPKDFVVISAHKPNVQFGNSILKRFPLLAEMPPLQTADSFQGREGSICVIITGTKLGTSAGWVANENRLNVMVTRQKSGLLVIGDKRVTGPLEGSSKEMTKADQKAKNTQVTVTTEGVVEYSNIRALRAVLEYMHGNGRIVEIKRGGGYQEEAEERRLAEEDKELAQEVLAQELDVGMNMFDEEETDD
ncbi:hypothetical protein B0T20DRAFT_491693, partial [Sordaria brevicollis]